MDTTERDDGRRARPILLGALAALLVLAPTAGAHDAGDSDEHGTMTLEFEKTEDACEVRVVAHNVDVEQATLLVKRPPGGPHDPPVVHEEHLNGTPEPEGGGFHFEAGPIRFEEDQFYWFELTWEGHSLRADWNHFSECAPTPLVRVHEDEAGGAVLRVDGCAFFVEGRHVRQESGSILVKGLHRDRDTEEATPVPPEEMEPDDVGNRFFVGPLEVAESGRHSVRFVDPAGDSVDGVFIDFVGCSEEPPECPPNVRVDVGENTNAVFWDAVQDATGYRVLRAEGDGELVVVDEEEHPSSVYVDHDVRPGVTYTYQVIAVGEVGVSEDCPTVEVTRPGGAEPEPEPCPPVVLTATANADGSVLVTATGVDGEAVLTRSDGGEALQVATLDAETATFLDTDTEVGTTYAYTLLVDGEACGSVEVTAIPVFPSLLAGGLAVAATLLGYVAVRRR